MGYETTSMAFVSLAANSPVIPIDVPDSGCCDYSFTADGQMLFTGDNHEEIGLWQVNPRTGSAKNLIRVPGYYGVLSIIQAPIQAPNGQIYFFGEIVSNSGSWWLPKLAVVDPAAVPLELSETSPLPFVTTEGYEPVLWLPDASRVLVQNKEGELGVLDSDDGSISFTGIHAYSLQWGVFE